VRSRDNRRPVSGNDANDRRPAARPDETAGRTVTPDENTNPTPRKPKNFVEDDDDFEFEFLDLDKDENKK
jgi:hypothetical protein